MRRFLLAALLLHLAVVASAARAAADEAAAPSATASMAQAAPDCTIGGLHVGEQAPEIRRPDYKIWTSRWLKIAGTKQYRHVTTTASATPYVEYIAVKDKQLVAVIREFRTWDFQNVMDALSARYGPPKPARGPWMEIWGDAGESYHVVWYNQECGLRIDALPTDDPDDREDERSVVVWTKGKPLEVPSAADAIR